MSLVDREMAEIAEAALTSAGATVWSDSSTAYPMLVADHPKFGVFAVDTADGDAEPMVRLNRKVAALRESVPGLARVPITRRLLDPRTVAADVVAGRWFAKLPDSPSDPAVRAALEDFFAPQMAVDLPVRSAMTDARSAARATHRIQLDARQASAAQRDLDGMLAITGPPGSGKTLVLCARANWLAENHPDWDIRVLCYNRMLVPYLEQLTARHPNIRVSTVGKFAAALGVRMSLSDPGGAMTDLAIAKRQLPNPLIDAVLIDEWQDFYPAWTALAEHVLRPRRGGIVVAGDPKQALYHDMGMGAGTTSPTETVSLLRPYRSTRQILDVTSALGNQLDVVGRHDALDGEPVDLVWAHNQADQAAAVARDVMLLLQEGERLPQDIGVLVTRKWSIGGLARALGEAGVPCRPVYSNQASDLDLSEPSVKIVTVHSAKGLEFDVVFLVGLEQLPDPDGTDDVDRQGRTGYVGATRARDQLVLSYTKDNAYLERIRSLSEDTLRRWVWPDDYPEA